MKRGISLACVFLVSCTQANGANCISFSAGRSLNNGEAFLSHYRLEGDIGDIELYSASFDLNKDGSSEYFYYLESPRFCGMQTGCDIGVYEYKDGGFRELIKYGLATYGRFDPGQKKHVDYVCVGEAENNGWAQLNIKDKRVFVYDGEHYVPEEH
jgi:hypothetical protein